MRFTYKLLTAAAHAYPGPACVQNAALPEHHACPLLLSPSLPFHQVPSNSRSQMWASFDGKDRQALGPGDAVMVRMSTWPVPTVCSKDVSRDWFSGVREGLHWNVRKPQAGAGM